MTLFSASCAADGDLLRVELAFEAPGQRTAQVAIDWISGATTGSVRVRVPGCDQPWSAACWTQRPLRGVLDSAQRARLLELLAPVPLADAPRHAAPGAAHYSVALVRRTSVAHGMARPGDGAAAGAVEQALALAGAGP